MMTVENDSAALALAYTIIGTPTLTIAPMLTMAGAPTGLLAARRQHKSIPCGEGLFGYILPENIVFGGT
jgi:hypothetical protein